MAKMITVYESSDGARLYETSDGTYHKSRDAAKQHEELLELESYVNENRIYTNTEVIDGAEFMEWLKENPRIRILLRRPEEL